jgi:hypothetical protein
MDKEQEFYKKQCEFLTPFVEKVESPDCTEEDVEKCIQAMMKALGEVSAFDEEHGGNDAELIKETLFHLSEFEKEL